MPTYTRYRDDLETPAPDENETFAKIVQVMTDGQNITRQKYGHAVRISHAKAHGLLKGELTVAADLPPELAQGLFARPGTYQVVARMATAPGEYTDDSKLSTDRGISLKVFGVEGPHLAPFEDITTQDFLLDVGKQFFTGDVKSFLQSFKPNAKIATHLSDTTKGVVSDVARVVNAGFNALGFNSEKLAFYGHPKRHPLVEDYYSQVAFRYGDHVAKLGLVPVTLGLEELAAVPFDPQTPDALREATVEFFRGKTAEFDFVVQLQTDEKSMPIEDAQAAWSEEESPYRPVARLVLPAQNAFDPKRAEVVDEEFSFSPAHSLLAHRPLGAMNRARLVAYTALAALRRQENGRPAAEPSSIDAVPA